MDNTEVKDAIAGQVQGIIDVILGSGHQVKWAGKRIARAFEVEMTRQYIEAGEPFGPANWEAVILWWDRARWVTHDEALYRWAAESTRAQAHGAPIPSVPKEPNG